MAQEKQRHQHSAEAKLSPPLAVGLATCVVVLACSGCWFALVNYSQQIGLEITWFIVTFAVLIVCLYGYFQGIFHKPISWSL